MKKLLILCLALCLFLTGCGNAAAPQSTTSPVTDTAGANPDEPEATTGPEEILGPTPLLPVGEFSDVPGGMMTADDLKYIEIMRIEAVDEYGLQYIYAWEYSFALGRFTTYVAEEVYDEQTIYVEKNDNFDCYVSTFKNNEFFIDPYADQIGYNDDLAAFADMIEFFVCYSVPVENTRYKRIEDQDTLTGEAYAYEVYVGDEHTGYLLVDKATGLAVTYTDREKKAYYQVTKIDTQDAGIPNYK